MVTSIQVEESLKKKLDSLKIHHRETYNDLIMRLIKSTNHDGVDRESLVETIEILGDPQTMRDIAEALEQYKKGKFKTLEQVEKDLNISN